MPDYGCVTEAFVYGKFAKPGLHCVIIYDPASTKFFKKIITLQHSPEKKTTQPRAIAENFVSSNVSFDGLPIQVFEPQHEIEAIFKSDIND